jgi:hypothetical protein
VNGLAASYSHQTITLMSTTILPSFLTATASSLSPPPLPPPLSRALTILAVVERCELLVSEESVAVGVPARPGVDRVVRGQRGEVRRPVRVGQLPHLTTHVTGQQKVVGGEALGSKVVALDHLTVLTGSLGEDDQVLRLAGRP